MRIAIEGCTHGELEKTYETLGTLEQETGTKVDLLICCGDFQSTRNLSDLVCMACPDKYKDMCSFYKYYSGEAIAPVLTIFIGGNHEATNYLQELAYGGWVAPNIYYLGYAGVIQVNGLRIGGLSGIYKGFDYLHGHHESPPYTESSMRSAYHIRVVEVFRLKQLASNPPDIMLSHDWPRSVTQHGNTAKLLRAKQHFREDIEGDKLGSPPARELLDTLQPKYWFSAHLHVKFPALVPHPDSRKVTKFLALDKCLPRRQFLQVMEVGPPVTDDDVVLSYDPSWLAILKSTSHLLSVEKKARYTPGPGSAERYDFTPTDEELTEIDRIFGGDFEVPYNFEQTALAFRPPANGGRPSVAGVPMPAATTNKQTTTFCSKLGIHDPMALLVGTVASATKKVNTSCSNNSLNYSHSAELLSKSWDMVAEKSQIWDSYQYQDLSTHEKDKTIDNTQSENVSDNQARLLKALEVEESPKISRPSLSIPAPKNDSEIDLSDIIEDTQDETKEENVDNLFVIDKEGELKPEVEEQEKPEIAANPDEAPLKKLKRRNASIYSSETE